VVPTEVWEKMTSLSVVKRRLLVDSGGRGAFRGGDGALRSYHINGGTAHPKGRCVRQPGDLVTLREAGGGGYGSPRERRVQSVLDDVQNGFVSVAAALAKYGVWVDPASGAAERAA
jgi:N-methylhydantoinase B